MHDDVLAASSNYRAHALAHGAATESGDHTKANKHHDGIVEALHSLRELGERGDQGLLELVGDSEPWVRCWAATHALAVDMRRGCTALEALTTSKGILGFTARTVLDEFSKGTLELP